MKVIRLVFVDFYTKNIERMTEYYRNVMGYQVTDVDSRGCVYLSNGLDHHNVVLTPFHQNGVNAYGYQMDGQHSLREVQDALRNRGIVSRLKSDPKPGISELLELEDPEGNRLEIFNNMAQPAPGFSEAGVVPLKLGHVAMFAIRWERTIEFYRDVLGFTLTDRIEDRANFLTCNTDHHTLNVVASKSISKMHHIAFQLKDSSHQYASLDLLSRKGIPVHWGPSRHTAGHNIATYHFDPDQNVVELFIDMDIWIPELGIFEPRPWHPELPLKPRVWKGLSAWGTEFEVTPSGN